MEPARIARSETSTNPAADGGARSQNGPGPAALLRLASSPRSSLAAAGRDALAAVGNRGLARAIAAAAPPALASRRALSRNPEEGYGYEFADDPLNAGGFGPNDATIRVRPGPVRTTIIGEHKTAAPQKTDETPPAAAAPPPAPSSTLSPVRQLVLAEVAKWSGAYELTDPRFYQVFTKSALESARIEAASDVHLSGPKKGEAKTPSKHTTCIDFQTVVYAHVRDAMMKDGKTKMPKIVTPMNAPSLSAFVKATPGMSADKRPKPGDFYILWSTRQNQKGEVEPKSFSHVAWLTGRSVNKDATEIWTSTDGGQGTAADIGPKGNVITQGNEAILDCTRTYFPDSNIIAGGVANQAAGGRWLLGWVDIDKLVQ